MIALRSAPANQGRGGKSGNFSLSAGIGGWTRQCINVDDGMRDKTRSTWLGSLPVVLSAVMPSFSGRKRVLGRSAGSKGAVYGSCVSGRGVL